ncbi:hypothetical protein ACIGW0_01040 [Streptomyces bikiniensis]|uniref:Uncharacterized protein n=1 Tax=Streptomyces bikiniensis TaxID=1896 RepID=A0ABW8CKB6_STRBI
MDPRGRPVAEERLPHTSTEPAEVLGRVAGELPRMLAAHGGGRTALALGFATGHWVDPAAGVVVHHPQPGRRDVPVREALAGATSCRRARTCPPAAPATSRRPSPTRNCAAAPGPDPSRKA